MVKYRWASTVLSLAGIDIILQIGNVTVFLYALLKAALYGNPYILQSYVFGVAELVDLDQLLPNWVATSTSLQLRILIIIGIVGICLGFQSWAAIALLGSTIHDKKPAEALKYAQSWGNITVILLAIYVAICLMTLSFVRLAIVLIYRGGGLYIVTRFIKELDDEQSLQSRDKAKTLTDPSV